VAALPTRGPAKGSREALTTVSGSSEPSASTGEAPASTIAPIANAWRMIEKEERMSETSIGVTMGTRHRNGDPFRPPGHPARQMGDVSSSAGLLARGSYAVVRL